eukprot:scaffold34819_cov147-Isochrysis_galbana.AAC.2
MRVPVCETVYRAGGGGCAWSLECTHIYGMVRLSAACAALIFGRQGLIRGVNAPSFRTIRLLTARSPTAGGEGDLAASFLSIYFWNYISAGSGCIWHYMVCGGRGRGRTSAGRMAV